MSVLRSSQVRGSRSARPRNFRRLGFRHSVHTQSPCPGRPGACSRSFEGCDGTTGIAHEPMLHIVGVKVEAADQSAQVEDFRKAPLARTVARAWNVELDH